MIYALIGTAAFSSFAVFWLGYRAYKAGTDSQVASSQSDTLEAVSKAHNIDIEISSLPTSTIRERLRKFTKP